MNQVDELRKLRNPALRNLIRQAAEELEGRVRASESKQVEAFDKWTKETEKFHWVEFIVGITATIFVGAMAILFIFRPH